MTNFEHFMLETCFGFVLGMLIGHTIIILSNVFNYLKAKFKK